MSFEKAPRRTSRADRGFSLLELMVAMVVTLVITGAMYGLMAQSGGTFRRAPATMDRQQQIRMAMDRIQEDVLGAGGSLGDFFQAFAENLNGVGPIGVRVAGDAALGGGNADALEIRSLTPDCPLVRVISRNAGTPVYNMDPAESAAIWPKPGWACLQSAGWVVARFPDGNGKFAWRHAAAGFNLNNQVLGPPPAGVFGSQMGTPVEWNCSLYTANIGGACNAPASVAEPPFVFGSLDRIRYEIAPDTDGVPALYRSVTGGFDPATETYGAPTPVAAQWQMVARGVEDLQVRYRTVDAAGADVWSNAALTIVPSTAAAATGWDNIVREVEVTLWARAIPEGAADQMQGETVAPGNGVRAIRGSLITAIAPRAAQVALANEPNAGKRWQ